jgi:hypothetical protein
MVGRGRYGGELGVGGYVSCIPIFKIVSKIILRKIACLLFSWLSDEACLRMENRSIMFRCEPLFW